MKDVKALGDQMIALNLKEVQELSSYLKDTYQIEFQALNSVVIPTTVTKEVEKNLFDVYLRSSGANKLQLIKLVKDLTGFELRKSKELVDSAPVSLFTGIDKTKATEIIDQLIKLGADVELK